MYEYHREDTDLDRVARKLAAMSGVVWDQLAKYPGYQRNYWREQAQTLSRAGIMHSLMTQ